LEGENLEEVNYRLDDYGLVLEENILRMSRYKKEYIEYDFDLAEDTEKLRGLGDQ
jgi:hypothetical protein